MSTKFRLLLWAIFLTTATIFAIANNGWHETKWLLLVFYLLAIVTELILHSKQTPK